MAISDTWRDRLLGSLLGLAVGDALGTAVEFQARDSFPPVTDMVGGGVFELAPGQWTDDTSMALCIAASLTETGAYDPRDQLARFAVVSRRVPQQHGAVFRYWQPDPSRPGGVRGHRRALPRGGRWDERR